MILHMQGDQEKKLYDDLEVINSFLVEEARINWKYPDDVDDVSVFFLQTFHASVHSVIYVH